MKRRLVESVCELREFERILGRRTGVPLWKDEAVEDIPWWLVTDLSRSTKRVLHVNARHVDL